MLDITTRQQAEVDWLIYNDPTTYVNLVLSSELESYAKTWLASIVWRIKEL